MLILLLLIRQHSFSHSYSCFRCAGVPNPSSSSSYLLSGDQHVIPHIRENSGLNKEPFQAQSFASTLHLGPFTDAALDEPQHSILLLPADLWRWRTDITWQRNPHFASSRKKGNIAADLLASPEDPAQLLDQRGCRRSSAWLSPHSSEQTRRRWTPPQRCGSLLCSTGPR